MYDERLYEGKDAENPTSGSEVGVDALVKPVVITLCGSTRFIKHFAVMAWEFEKQGAIVLGLHYLPPEYFDGKFDGEIVSSHLAEYEGVAEHFDNLHLRKIDMSDKVYVLNVGGYIGESTRREINYALSQGKPVSYLEEV